MGKFLTLMILIIGVFATQAQDTAPTTFEDPEGFFTVPIPTNWTIEQQDLYSVLSDPENLIKVYLFAVPTTDLNATIDEHIQSIIPDFDKSLDDANIMNLPSDAGVEETVMITYEYEPSDTVIYQGIGQLKDGMGYYIIFDADVIASSRRQAQINVIATGFKITALETKSLTPDSLVAIDNDLIAEFERFIEGALEVTEVPGVSIGIVKDGEIIYANGFGVTELGTEQPVTPETLMMIGSVSKTFTTLYLAQLVESGVVTWDTPVIDVLPSFRIGDETATNTITIRNLLCACTGVPRRDMEIIFNANELSAEDIINSLADFQLFTEFGEAFQYSNQLIATGGYVGAIANGSTLDDAYGSFMADIQQMILDPVGMGSTTADFDTVTANPNYALPHGVNLETYYQTVDLEVEKFVTPVAPAGALWSNVLDMSNYMLTYLNDGVTPNGETIITHESLLELWQPQIAISAQMDYALGWMVSDYHGLTLLAHGGNTLGFTADMSLIPEVDLGIVILTNAQGANILTETIREKFLELIFDQEPMIQDLLDYYTQQSIESREAVNITPDLDLNEFEAYVGDYHNTELGDLAIRIEEGRVIVDTTEFVSEVWGNLGDADEIKAYVIYDGALVGTPLEFEIVDDVPQITIDIFTDQYTFTPTN